MTATLRIQNEEWNFSTRTTARLINPNLAEPEPKGGKRLTIKGKEKHDGGKSFKPMNANIRQG